MSQWWVIQLWKKSGWDKKKLAVESWHIVAHCNHYNQQPGSERLGQAQPSTSPLSHPLIKESKLLEPVLPHCKNATWCSWQSRAKIREQWCQSWSKSRQVKQLKPSIIFKESSDKKKRPRVKNVHSMLAKNFAWTRIRFRNIISNQTTRIPWRSSRRKSPGHVEICEGRSFPSVMTTPLHHVTSTISNLRVLPMDLRWPEKGNLTTSSIGQPWQFVTISSFMNAGGI